MIRLDRLLVELGLGSRREVHALLRAGRVEVDGQIRREPALHLDPAVSVLRVDGAPRVWRRFHHRLVHKPPELVTSTSDRDGTPVTALLRGDDRALPWMPVGRLDRDAEGLLLLTTHGELAHRLAHPRWHVPKVYAVTLADPAVPEDVAAFAEGLTLHDGPALPAALRLGADPRAAEVTVQEGRYHQVKRMFAARGNRVVRLVRIGFGPLALPADLAAGEIRPTTDAEEAALYAAVGLTG